MTNTVNAKQRNQDPDMDAIIARMMNVTKRGTTLSTNQKYFVLLATCAAQGLSEEAEDVTAAALKAGVEPIVIKEAVYQTAPYVGVGRVKEALEGVNEALKDAGVRLPLASQTTKIAWLKALKSRQRFSGTQLLRCTRTRLSR